MRQGCNLKHFKLEKHTHSRTNYQHSYLTSLHCALLSLLKSLVAFVWDKIWTRAKKLHCQSPRNSWLYTWCIKVSTTSSAIAIKYLLHNTSTNYLDLRSWGSPRKWLLQMDSNHTNLWMRKFEVNPSKKEKNGFKLSPAIPYICHSSWTPKSGNNSCSQMLPTNSNGSNVVHL